MKKNESWSKKMCSGTQELATPIGKIPDYQDRDLWESLATIWRDKGITDIELMEKPSVNRTTAMKIVAAHITGGCDIRQIGYLISQYFEDWKERVAA